jgi:AAA domain
MAKTNETVNGSGGYAPLRNLLLAFNALEHAIARPAMLPGIVCFYGPSGYGKSVAAVYCANRTRGILVECSSTDTAKNVLSALTEEAGLRQLRTVSDMQKQLIEELAVSRRPLIIDEVDHIAEGKTLQLIRDLHDKSGCAVLLIGEESLPFKLKRTDRFHNRVLLWQPAEPADERDVQSLISFYSPDVAIADELRQKMLGEVGLVVRRIAVNLHNMREFGKVNGLKEVTLSAWGKRPFYTGVPPRRVA